MSCCMRTKNDTDCVDTPNSASVPVAKRHAIIVYSSEDLTTWKAHYNVFVPVIDKGVMYRPHVLFNEMTNKFVMWYKVHFSANRTSTYGVAASENFAGPFKIVVDSVPDLWSHGAIGDEYLFQDDDGKAYLVRHKAIEQLNETFTGVDKLHRQTLPSNGGWEGTVMFKRIFPGNVARYYVLGGHYCCACKGGSNVYVFMAEGSPLSNYIFVGDIGRNGTENQDKHSPYRWITRAQTSTAFTVKLNPSKGNSPWEHESAVVILGNQWITATGATHYARNKDLLYWMVLEFDNATGIPAQIEHSQELVLDLALTDEL